MSHLPLDARAILQHLNDLGYRNISAEQLREFLKDLRKLIKHEDRVAQNPKKDYFSSLHQRNTVSSKAKLGDKAKDKDKENVTTSNSKQQLPDPERLASGLNDAAIAALFRKQLKLDEPEDKSGDPSVRPSRSRIRSASKVRNRDASSDEKKSPVPPLSRKSRRPRSTSRKSLKVRSKSRSKVPRSDPVALYQYYQKEWSHFRHRIPQ